MDKWIHGQGVTDDQEYIVRTEPPRCIILVHSDEARGLIEPYVVVNEYDEEFAVVMWLDPEPDEDTHLRVLNEAMAAHELFTQESMDD